MRGEPGKNDRGLQRRTPENRTVPQPTTYIEGEAFSGADKVFGEGGNDSVSGGKEEPATNAADLVDGGAGFDEIPNVDAD